MNGTERVFIVSPVYNEGRNVDVLVEKLEETCAPVSPNFRVLLVNDGSDPETTDVLNALVSKNPRVGVLHLSRNFGHQAALSAGLLEAHRLNADAVVCMDSDLQHPPALVPELLAQWRAGYDVVYTLRDDSVRTGWFKRLTARIFYKFLSLISDTPVPRGAADFRLVSRPALEALASLPERARFLRALSRWIGFRQVGIHYAPDPRRSGTTKYTFQRMYRLAVDGVISTTTLPLRLILFVGLFVSLISLLYLAYVVVAHFFTDRTLPGWSSVIVAVLFLGGMNLTVLGVMGLYLAKVYEEVKGRPLFLVRERRGLDGARDDVQTRPS